MGSPVKANTRDYLINGKLEMFLVIFPKEKFLKSVEDFYTHSSLDTLFRVFSFSMQLVDTAQDKVPL